MESTNRAPSMGAACQEGPIWAVQHAAAHKGVHTQFYRRHILTLPNHPPPVDPSAKRLLFWREMLEPWLDNPENLIRNPEAWEGQCAAGGAR
jgi:hypothetical protein